MALTYTKPEIISLKDNAEFNESWLRDRIVDDPSILGLGDLEIKAVEKIQPRAGRLDLLMYDPEAGKRYEVELMLGTVNESHIIRCIEYWDIERKRYPQYDHTAVLVAENVTARFLNVIGLFNGAIPMIAIQLTALKVGENIVLNFTKVLDEIIPGEDDEDAEDGTTTDREYWENRASKDSLAVVDSCISLIREFDPSLGPKFNKYYIGLTDQSRSRNFVIFKPKKQFVRVGCRVGDLATWQARLEEAELDILRGQGRNRVGFRLEAAEFQRNQKLLCELFQACYQESQD